MILIPKGLKYVGIKGELAKGEEKRIADEEAGYVDGKEETLEVKKTCQGLNFVYITTVQCYLCLCLMYIHPLLLPT